MYTAIRRSGDGGHKMVRPINPICEMKGTKGRGRVRYGNARKRRCDGE